MGTRVIESSISHTLCIVDLDRTFFLSENIFIRYSDVTCTLYSQAHSVRTLIGEKSPADLTVST